MVSGIDLLRQRTKSRSETARRRWQDPRYRLKHYIARSPSALPGLANNFVHRTGCGYVMRKSPLHPRAQDNGYVLDHILVWEADRGRSLDEGLIIHHLNGVASDNGPENLEAMSRSKHSAFHYWLRINKREPSERSLYEFSFLRANKLLRTSKKARGSGSGYVMRKSPLHPRAYDDDRVLEHILVWEADEGRSLDEGLIIHHLNGVPSDNRRENLEAMSKSKHTRFHYWLRQNKRRPSKTALKEWTGMSRA